MLKNISFNIIVSLLFSGTALAQTPKFADEMPMSHSMLGAEILYS